MFENQINELIRLIIQDLGFAAGRTDSQVTLDRTQGSGLHNLAKKNQK